MKNNSAARSIYVIGALFFVFGFVTWINSVLIPFLKQICELTDFQAYFVTFAFYISYGSNICCPFCCIIISFYCKIVIPLFCSFFILITVIIKIYFWPFCFQICCYGFYSNIHIIISGIAITFCSLKFVNSSL